MNSNLQNKLSRFEATPPPGVWGKIAEALDEQQTFPQRLYNYQQVPKTNVWEKIEASFEESAAKVIPFTTRYRRPIHYIAAAGVIAAILVSFTLLMKKTEAGSIPTAEEKTVPVKEAIVQNPITRPTISSINSTETIASAETNNRNPVYQIATKGKKILGIIRPQNSLSAVILKGRFMPGKVDKEALFNFFSLNDHMVYSDGDGNAMKLPKKLFSLVSCPDGDGSCKERIHQLQQKLSSTAMTADFTGVLDMLRQLQ